MLKIMVAVDASEPARKAAERATSLASAFEAKVTLVHAYEANPVETARILSIHSLIEERRRACEGVVAALAAELDAPQVATRVQFGRNIPGAICDSAQELGASLIVMGATGRTGVSRFFLGSVAESVMRRAHCPVWIEYSAGPVWVRRILVCTDLSPASEAGLVLAAEVSAVIGGAVEVVYALDNSYDGLSLDVRRKLVADLRQQVTELVSKHFTEGHPSVSVVEGANIVDGITAHAARTSADLIVLATHGRTGLNRKLLGSVAERVARFAPCSVLVARSEATPA